MREEWFIQNIMVIETIEKVKPRFYYGGVKIWNEKEADGVCQ